MKIKHFMFFALIGLFTADLSAQTPQQLRDTINFRFRTRPMDKSFGTADLRAATLPIVDVIEANKINSEATYAKKTALSDSTLTLKSLINQKAVQAVSTAVGTSKDYTDSFFPIPSDATKANSAALRDTARDIRADLVDKYKYVNDSRTADSIANVAKFNLKANQAGLDSINHDFWKLSGNSFFANQIYKFGVKSGVNMSTSTNVNYFDAANKIVIGLNVDSYDDYSADRAIMQIQSDQFSINAKNGTKQFNVILDRNRFGMNWYENSISSGFNVNYTNFGVVNFVISGKKTGGANGFSSSINFADNVSWMNATWGGLGSTYQNGDIFLNKESQRIHIKVDGAIKTVALTSEVILKATVVPTSTSDTTGNVGDEISDANYKYVKTSAGWKRFALSTF